MPGWATYHVHELVPFIDASYPTVASRSARAVAGLSMGGFGAMSYAGRHPATSGHPAMFKVAASFSGALDMLYGAPATGV